MTWRVIELRAGAGLGRVHGVRADRVERTDTSLTCWDGERVVFQAPADKVVAIEDCQDRAEALERMRDRQRSVARKGLQGEELPAAPRSGKPRQVGTAVERVGVVLEQGTATRR